MDKVWWTKFGQGFKEEITKPKLWAEVFKSLVIIGMVAVIKSSLSSKKNEKKAA